jgi:hypothetical protein
MRASHASSEMLSATGETSERLDLQQESLEIEASHSLIVSCAEGTCAIVLDDCQLCASGAAGFTSLRLGAGG